MLRGSQVAVASLVVSLSVAVCAAQEFESDRMLQYLRSRVDSSPDDASAWRLLGGYAIQHGDVASGINSLRRAIELDPANAAAHFDLANGLEFSGLHEEAEFHYREAATIAPSSEYAQFASDRLAYRESAIERNGAGQVAQVSYDVQRFDGSNRAAALVESSKGAANAIPWNARVDVGANYNSNVAISPISRSLGSSSQASAQGFVSPSLEYRWFSTDVWTSGVTFDGYFNVNENSALQSFNLQSYKPGIFVEQMVSTENSILIPRLQYNYTYDLFDGATFGNRHATTASITNLWDRGDTSVVYWSSAFTNFADDGTTPATSSRDGWTHTIGASHEFPVSFGLVRGVTIGGDSEWGDITGSDYTYYGGMAYSSISMSWNETWRADLGGGWGARDYYRSHLSPSRNETLWRGSAKLTKQLTESWSISGVFSYDRFDSKNTSFAADRYIAGILTTWEY